MLSEMQPAGGAAGGLAGAHAAAAARYPAHSMTMSAMSNTSPLGMVSPQLSSLYNTADNYYRSVQLKNVRPHEVPVIAI